MMSENEPLRSRDSIPQSTKEWQVPPVATTESMTVDWGAGIFKHQDGAAGAISMEYGWGSYAVKHTRSGPLSLDRPNSPRTRHETR
jgi:hypothetical protein